MSEAKQDGGPAFPACYYETEHGDRVWATSGTGGMSLRDYFAAKAIHCFLLSPQDINDLLSGCPANHAVVAKFCYELADAMIREGQK